jgi:hypothetical protein
VEETGRKETRNIWSARRGTWGVVAAVTILPLLAFGMTVGSAQAQPGSRVCGAYWEGEDSAGNKVIWAQAEEAPKTDHFVCDEIRQVADNYRGPDDWAVGGSRALHMWTCEKFGKLLNNEYGADPCLNMERRDNSFVSGRISTFSASLD